MPAGEPRGDGKVPSLPHDPTYHLPGQARAIPDASFLGLLVLPTCSCSGFHSLNSVHLHTCSPTAFAGAPNHSHNFSFSQSFCPTPTPIASLPAPPSITPTHPIQLSSGTSSPGMFTAPLELAKRILSPMLDIHTMKAGPGGLSLHVCNVQEGGWHRAGSTHGDKFNQHGGWGGGLGGQTGGGGLKDRAGEIGKSHITEGHVCQPRWPGIHP